MTNIAFIGLGTMGAPMALHLQNAGFVVTGRNRSPKYEDLIAAGGKGASSVAEAVVAADIVAIMVPDSPDVAGVLRDEEDGVFAHAQPGTLIVDFSSIRPDIAQELAAEARERGFRMLDAPVSGGEPGAINAALSIMVGGDAEDFAAARPVLDVVGKTIVHVGPSGAGQTVKAANQLIVATNIQGLAEALLFLEAYGVDMPAAVAVLGGGLAGSAVLNQKAQKILDRDFTPGFRINLHHKDLGIVTSAAREAGIPLPVGATLAQLMASTLAQGDGDLDHSALFRTTQKLAGHDN